VLTGNVYGQTEVWCDGFEGYAVNTAPIPPWAQSGNQSIRVVNDVYASGSQSMRAYGVVGGCWGTSITRLLETSFPLSVSMSIRNGSENLYGCHPYRGSMGLKTGTFWGDPGIGIFQFLENGDFRVDLTPTAPVFSGYALNQWHDVRIELKREGNLILGKFWINNDYLGEFSRDVSEVSYIDSLRYFNIAAQEGTVWFDDVCVSSGPNTGQSDLTISDVSVSPETPTAYDAANITVTIRNSGDATWVAKDLLLQVSCIDVKDVGYDGLILDILPSNGPSNGNVRYLNFVMLNDIPSLAPGEEFTGTYSFKFNAPDYTDKAFFELVPILGDNSIDDVKESSDIYTYHPFQVLPNDEYMLLNCASSIIAAITGGVSVDADFLDLLGKTIKVAQYSDDDAPEEASWIVPLSEGDPYLGFRNLLEYVKHYYDQVSLALIPAGGPLIPGGGLFAAVINELLGRGCSGLISHAITTFEIADVLYPGCVLWGVSSPADLIAVIGSDSIVVSGQGSVQDGSDRAVGLYYDEAKVILLDATATEYDLRFSAYDTGAADFFYRTPQSSMNELLYYNDVNLFETSTRYIDRESANMLQIDDNGDGVVDRSILPIVLRPLAREGWIEGHVKITEGAGLEGVPVDVFDSSGVLWKSLATDENGFYSADSIPFGSYSISVVTPLGYQADQETRLVTVDLLPVTVDFEITELVVTPVPRSRAYWAHQLQKALQSRPKDYSQEDFSQLAGLIDRHFNGNSINPVDFYSVQQPANQTDSLDVLKNLLHMRNTGDWEPMLRRLAKSQLMALMLNVVSGKVSQTQEITADGRTVSQLITYSDMLVSDEIDPPDDHGCPGHGSPWFRYIYASFMLVKANLGLTVPAGMIPEDVIQIAYKLHEGDNLPEDFALNQNYPNPFNPVTEISFSLPEASKVKLDVFNMLGQKVTTIYEGKLEAGTHSFSWDGSSVSSGVYLYRLTAGDFVETKKMVLLK